MNQHISVEHVLNMAWQDRIWVAQHCNPTLSKVYNEQWLVISLLLALSEIKAESLFSKSMEFNITNELPTCCKLRPNCILLLVKLIQVKVECEFTA